MKRDRMCDTVRETAGTARARAGSMRTSLRAHTAAGLLIIAMLAGTLAGCDVLGFGGGGVDGGSSSTGAQIPSVTVEAKDFSLDLPDSMPSAGLISLTLHNQGQQPHQMNVARLNDGVTQDQVTNALKADPGQVLPLISFVGGPNIVDPGQSQTVTVEMPAGTYLAVCFAPDVTNPAKNHAQMGMYKFFTVPASSGSAPAEPADSGLVTLRDFHIELPSPGPFNAGQTTWKIWNHGGQPHEMALLKLAQGKTSQDAISFLEQQNPSGPPPFSDAGGIGALGVDKSGWATLDLTPGNYVALCYVPDPSTGQPHFMMGMHQAFSVE